MDIHEAALAVMANARQHRKRTKHEFPYPDFHRCLFHALIETAEYADALERPLYPEEIRAKKQMPDPVLELGQVGYMIASGLALLLDDRKAAEAVASVNSRLRQDQLNWTHLMMALLNVRMFPQEALAHTTTAFAIWLHVAQDTCGVLHCLNQAMANIDQRITYHK